MDKTITISKRQLYLEIWSHGVSKIAKKYNLNYAKFIEALKANNIPYPSSGYWTKINLGKDVRDEFKKLPESNVEELKLLVKREKLTKQIIKETYSQAENKQENIDAIVDKYMNDYLLQYKQDKRRTIIKTVVEVVLKKHHKSQVIKDYIEEVNRYKKYLGFKSTWYSYESNSYIERPALYGKYSKDTEDRVFGLLNTIVIVVERLGGKIVHINEYCIDEQKITINIREKQNKVLHIRTDKENKEYQKYVDRKRYDPYAYPPRFDEYDYKYSGVLEMRICDGDWCNKEFHDTKTTSLEDRIIDIILYIYERVMSGIIRKQERIEAEQEKRRRYEEACAQERIYKDELARVDELVNEANDYQTAILIRKYIKSKKNSDKKWTTWASNIADWYDPNIRRDDEVLGQKGEKKKFYY